MTTEQEDKFHKIFTSRLHSQRRLYPSTAMRQTSQTTRLPEAPELSHKPVSFLCFSKHYYCKQSYDSIIKKGFWVLISQSVGFIGQPATFELNPGWSTSQRQLKFKLNSAASVTKTEERTHIICQGEWSEKIKDLHKSADREPDFLRQYNCLPYSKYRKSCQSGMDWEWITAQDLGLVNNFPNTKPEAQKFH